jgi:hypothetical protein
MPDTEAERLAMALEDASTEATWARNICELSPRTARSAAAELRRLAAMEADALRYREFRVRWTAHDYPLMMGVIESRSADGLDAAIDSARAEGGKT